MSGTHMSGIDELQVWAENIIALREPDFIIGDNYLRRWWIIPRNPLCNVYLHEINHSDDPRALHDHPWDNTSLLLRGSYTEVTSDGEATYNRGDIIHRPATSLHRLVVPDNARVLSLFQTGPVIREWGFQCPQGWRHWKEFTAFSKTGTSGQIGRGCD